MLIADALQNIKNRFSSADGTPVTESIITNTEYQALLPKPLTDEQCIELTQLILICIQQCAQNNTLEYSQALVNSNIKRWYNKTRGIGC